MGKKFKIIFIFLCVLSSWLAFFAVDASAENTSTCKDFPLLGNDYPGFDSSLRSSGNSRIYNRLAGKGLARGDTLMCRDRSSDNDADTSSTGDYSSDTKCSEIKAPPDKAPGYYTNKYKCSNVYFAHDSNGLVQSTVRSGVHTVLHEMSAVPGSFLIGIRLNAIITPFPINITWWAFLFSVHTTVFWAAYINDPVYSLSAMSVFPSPEFLYSKFQLDRLDTPGDPLHPAYKISQHACLTMFPSTDGQCRDVFFGTKGQFKFYGQNTFDAETSASIGTASKTYASAVTGSSSYCLTKTPPKGTFTHGGINNTKHIKVCGYVVAANTCSPELPSYAWDRALISCVDEPFKPAPPLLRKHVKNNTQIITAQIKRSTDFSDSSFFVPNIKIQKTISGAAYHQHIKLFSPNAANYSPTPDPEHPENICGLLNNKNYCCGPLNYRLDGQDLTEYYCVANGADTDKIIACKADTCARNINFSVSRPTPQDSNSKIVTYANYCLTESQAITYAANQNLSSPIKIDPIPYMRIYHALSDSYGSLYYLPDFKGSTNKLQYDSVENKYTDDKGNKYNAIQLKYDDSTRQYLDMSTKITYSAIEIANKFQTGIAANFSQRGISGCYCFDNNICPYSSAMSNNLLIPAFNAACGIEGVKIFDYFESNALNSPDLGPAKPPLNNIYSGTQICSGWNVSNPLPILNVNSAGVVTFGSSAAAGSSGSSNTSDADSEDDGDPAPPQSTNTNNAENCKCNLVNQTFLTEFLTQSNSNLAELWKTLKDYYSIIGGDVSLFPQPVITPSFNYNSFESYCPNYLKLNNTTVDDLTKCNGQKAIASICQSIDAVFIQYAIYKNQVPLNSWVCPYITTDENDSCAKAEFKDAGNKYRSSKEDDFKKFDANGNNIEKNITDWKEKYNAAIIAKPIANHAGYLTSCTAANASDNGSTPSSSAASSATGVKRTAVGTFNENGKDSMFGLRFKALVAEKFSDIINYKPLLKNLYIPKISNSSYLCESPTIATNAQTLSGDEIYSLMAPAETRTTTKCDNWSISSCTFESKPTIAEAALLLCPGIYTPRVGSSDIMCLESQNASWSALKNSLNSSYNMTCAALPKNGCVAINTPTDNSKWMTWGELLSGHRSGTPEGTPSSCPHYNPDYVKFTRICALADSAESITSTCTLPADAKRVNNTPLSCNCPNPALTCSKNLSNTNATYKNALWKFDTMVGDEIYGYCSDNAATKPIITCLPGAQISVTGSCESCGKIALSDELSKNTNLAVLHYYQSWKKLFPGEREAKRCKALGQENVELTRACNISAAYAVTTSYTSSAADKCFNPCDPITSSNPVVNKSGPGSQYLTWKAATYNDPSPQIKSCIGDEAKLVKRTCEIDADGDIVSKYYNNTTGALCSSMPGGSCCNDPCGVVTKASDETGKLTWDKALIPGDASVSQQTKACRIGNTPSVTRTCSLDSNDNLQVQYSGACESLEAKSYILLPQGKQCFERCDKTCERTFGGVVLDGISLPFDPNADLISWCKMYCKVGQNFIAKRRGNNNYTSSPTGFYEINHDYLPQQYKPNTPYVVMESTYNGKGFKLEDATTQVQSNARCEPSLMDWDTGMVVYPNSTINLYLDTASVFSNDSSKTNVTLRPSSTNGVVENDIPNEIILCGHDWRFADYIGDKSVDSTNGPKFFFGKNDYLWDSTMYWSTEDKIDIWQYGAYQWKPNDKSHQQDGGLIMRNLGQSAYRSKDPNRDNPSYGTYFITGLNDSDRQRDAFHRWTINGFGSGCKADTQCNTDKLVDSFRDLRFDVFGLNDASKLVSNYGGIDNYNAVSRLFRTQSTGLGALWTGNSQYLFKVGFAHVDENWADFNGSSDYSKDSYKDNLGGTSLRIERKGCVKTPQTGIVIEYAFANANAASNWMEATISSSQSIAFTVPASIPEGSKLFIRPKEIEQKMIFTETPAHVERSERGISIKSAHIVTKTTSGIPDLLHSNKLGQMKLSIQQTLTD